MSLKLSTHEGTNELKNESPDLMFLSKEVISNLSKTIQSITTLVLHVLKHTTPITLIPFELL